MDVHITEKQFEHVFDALEKGKISKDVVMNILIDYSKGKFTSIQDYAAISDKELEKEIKKIIKENKGVPFNALIGRAMAKLKGKAEGRKIVEFLKKYSS